MLAVRELQSICDGRWRGDCPEGVVRLCSDSRSLQTGDVFLALRGVSFDGHAFGAAVADRAVALIGDTVGMQQWQGLDVPQLMVDDTLHALGHIAHAYRCSLVDTCVIAMTGSYGKTTVRSMLCHAFNRLGVRTHATMANNNNCIGVPQTLLHIPAATEVALIECGISERGEMAYLAGMVAPDLAVLTGLGLAHGEGLGSLANIAVEKYRLIEAMRGNAQGIVGDGVAIHLPCDAAIMNPATNVQWRLVKHSGIKPKAAVLLQWNGEQAHVTLPLPAAHWAADMALVATVILSWAANHGRKLNLTMVAESLTDWQAEPQRLCALTTDDGVTILDDVYNANPASMQAALDTLVALSGRNMAVLGDMAELGADSTAAHCALDVTGVDDLVLVGAAMHTLADQTKQCRWFAHTDDALCYLQGIDTTVINTILVKASRSMHFERIVTMFTVNKRNKQHAL